MWLWLVKIRGSGGETILKTIEFDASEHIRNDADALRLLKPSPRRSAPALRLQWLR